MTPTVHPCPVQLGRLWVAYVSYEPNVPQEHAQPEHTDTAHNLNKKVNLQHFENTVLDAKIECGHVGDVQFLGSIFAMWKTNAEHPQLRPVDGAAAA